jgi:hypothetical protein
MILFSWSVGVKDNRNFLLRKNGLGTFRSLMIALRWPFALYPLMTVRTENSFSHLPPSANLLDNLPTHPDAMCRP